MTAVVELVNVTKTYGRNEALADVSLQVPQGVVFALLGENGAGKTTAIRIIKGVRTIFVVAKIVLTPFLS